MKESKFICEMQPRLTAASDGLNSWLDQTAISVIRDNNTSSLSRLLRIYATIGRISGSERLVREEIIRPAVESCLVEEELANCGRRGGAVVCVEMEGGRGGWRDGGRGAGGGERRTEAG